MKVVFVDVLHRNQEARMKVVFVAVQLLSTCSSTMTVRRLTNSHLSPTEEQAEEHTIFSLCPPGWGQDLQRPGLTEEKKYLASSPSPLTQEQEQKGTGPPLPRREEDIFSIYTDGIDIYLH